MRNAYLCSRYLRIQTLLRVLRCVCVCVRIFAQIRQHSLNMRMAKLSCGFSPFMFRLGLCLQHLDVYLIYVCLRVVDIIFSSNLNGPIKFYVNSAVNSLLKSNIDSRRGFNDERTVQIYTYSTKSMNA